MSAIADVSLVYIAEAHASNEWPIHSSRCTPDNQAVEIAQPETLADRLRVATAFVDRYHLSGVRVLVDTPEDMVMSTAEVVGGNVGDETENKEVKEVKEVGCNGGINEVLVKGNSFEREFAAWPLRFYVILNGRITYIADPEDGRFSVSKLRSAIQQAAGVIPRSAGQRTVSLV